MTTPILIEHPAYFDRLAEVESAHWWSRGMWRLAAHWLDTALLGRHSLQALDVGCGTGLTAVRLARRPEIDAVVGLDPSADALALAQRHGLALVRGSALDLPFDDARFDVATCFDVFQHLPEGGDARAARELFRVLRPGGIVVVRSNALTASARSAPGAVCYRLQELLHVLRGAGLTVRQASYANCLPALLQEIRGRISRLAGGETSGHPSGGGLRIRMPHPVVNRLMEGVSNVEAALAGKLRTPLPFGHSTMLLAVKLN